MGDSPLRLAVLGNESAVSAIRLAAARIPELTLVTPGSPDDCDVLVLERDALARRPRDPRPTVLLDLDLRPGDVASQLDAFDSLLGSTEPAALLCAVHLAIARSRDRATLSFLARHLPVGAVVRHGEREVFRTESFDERWLEPAVAASRIAVPSDGATRFFDRADISRGDLSAAFVTDATRLQALETAAFGAARASTVQELSRGVIHDLNNVFCVVQSFSELLLESTPASDPRLRDLQEIASASQRAAVLIDRLVGFSRSGLHRPENFNVAEHQRRLEPLLRRLLGERFEVLIVASPSDLTGVFDPFVFTQTVLDVAARLRDLAEAGLFTLDSKGEPGSVTTTISLAASTGARMREARVRDSIPAAPEFIAARGGRLVEVDPFTFQLTMPRAGAEASLGEVVGGSETVLVVEDEQAVRLALARALRSLGYTVHEARLGADARVVAKANRIDLVITDVVLPDGDGLELLGELARSPTRALVVTGYADRELHRLDARVPLLRKPFAVSDLARKVRAALAS
jgi:CheY-like chemotaxis protein/signal transduction histidine kinase